MVDKNRLITENELLKNNKDGKLWILIDNKVYDLTEYQNVHPGSDSILHDVMDIDATQEFQDVGHSTEADKIKESYQIGFIDKDSLNKMKMSNNCTDIELENNKFKAWLPISIFIFLFIMVIYSLNMV